MWITSIDYSATTKNQYKYKIILHNTNVAVSSLFIVLSFHDVNAIIIVSLVYWQLKLGEIIEV